MLRDPPDDIGMFAEQLFVPLSGRVSDPGEEELLVGVQPVDESLFVDSSCGGMLLDQREEVCFSYRQCLRRFDAFQGEEARCLVV